MGTVARLLGKGFRCCTDIENFLNAVNLSAINNFSIRRQFNSGLFVCLPVWAAGVAGACTAAGAGAGGGGGGGGQGSAPLVPLVDTETGAVAWTLETVTVGSPGKEQTLLRATEIAKINLNKKQQNKAEKTSSNEKKKFTHSTRARGSRVRKKKQKRIRASTTVVQMARNLDARGRVRWSPRRARGPDKPETSDHNKPARDCAVEARSLDGQPKPLTN
ncbi:SMEK protein [Trichinella spiralis]|uniref:SMEK protein n=1 Tax=Trichinella spiralis TaxID=6334 RepID=UPI0001EFC7A9|nr:SMEK protein [Trichinella spiralis]